MIPYELIIPSASRPHLLRPVLASLLSRVDQPPQRVLVHDDAAFPGRRDETQGTVREVCQEFEVPWEFGHDDPPVFHGAALHWLLSRVQTSYCLYSQDDHVVLRPLPLCATVAVMDQHGLHQVRFNKRATMGWKGHWRKHEVLFPRSEGASVRLTIADHWYFQTGVWRTERIRWAVDWWMAYSPQSFREHAEVKINQVFNRGVPEVNKLAPFPLPPSNAEAMDPQVRREYQRTFIWGGVGEDKFVEHIGGDPKDWALLRGRGGVGIRDSQGPAPPRWCEGHRQVCTHE